MRKVLVQVARGETAVAPAHPAKEIGAVALVRDLASKTAGLDSVQEVDSYPGKGPMGGTRETTVDLAQLHVMQPALTSYRQLELMCHT